MTALRLASILAFSAALAVAFPANAQTAPPTSPAQPGSQPGGPGQPPRGPRPAPTNLKALPKTTSGDDVQKIMRQFTGDLGVQCEFCHAAPDPTTHRADRASDANPVKETARFMITMTDDLNNQYLANLPGRRYADPITCGTCHRGKDHPSIFVPPNPPAPPLN